MTGYVIAPRKGPIPPACFRSFALSEEEAWRAFLPWSAIHDYWVEMARWRVAGYRPRRVTIAEA